jgi:hypothetical protein
MKIEAIYFLEMSGFPETTWLYNIEDLMLEVE